jgi:hypothetical protein
MLDKQQTFDRVLAHLRAQGVPATASPSGGACNYRTKDGRMCAIGVLIPDNLYDPRIEGDGAGTVWHLIPDADREDVLFLTYLQKYMHDGPASRGAVGYMSRVEGGARQVAGRFGLTYREPTNA